MPKTETKPTSTAAPAQGSLEIRDARTGKDYKLPVVTEGAEGDTRLVLGLAVETPYFHVKLSIINR